MASDAEVILALAGAPIAVTLGLFVAAVIHLFRRGVSRAGHEVGLIRRAARLRSPRAIVDGIGALGVLSGLLIAALLAAPLVLLVVPLLVAAVGLELTAHLIHVSH